MLPWTLLRTFDAVARSGTFTRAAKRLNVSQSTVSRHINKLEEMAGSPLLIHSTPLELTQRGVALLDAIEPMVHAALAAHAVLEDIPEVSGQVTVSTVGELIRWSLVDQLSGFYAEHPQVQLRLLASNQVSRLASGEADIALRMFRPKHGDLVARRLTTTSYGVFGHQDLALSPETPWLGLTGSLADISDQRFADELFGPRPARLLVEDLESLGLAVEAKLGVAILPKRFVPRLRGVVAVDVKAMGLTLEREPEQREIWMVVHRSKQHLPRVRAVMTWLTSVIL